ncbi:MAG: ribosome-binding factor A [Planctomycetota bacterium]
MNLSKKTREEMLRYCANIDNDADGKNPRDDKSIHSYEKRDPAIYRQQRLCRQIAETLSLALSDAPDPLVAAAQLLMVKPRKGAKSVTVRVATTDADIAQLREALQASEGWLRSEVAAAISRKRVPRLVFEISQMELESDEGGHDDER